MSISSVMSSSSSASTPDYSSDPQVQRIEAQIKDWTNCPTTDAQTKKKIVGQLQTQLDGVESQIKQQADLKKEASKPPATAPSEKGRLDISV
jgi:hypothetical protein